MRWRPTRMEDTTPRLRRCSCGGNAKAIFDNPSRIECAKCGMRVAVETAPFFRHPARQREHEAWRAADAWNAT